MLFSVFLNLSLWVFIHNNIFFLRVINYNMKMKHEHHIKIHRYSQTKHISLFSIVLWQPDVSCFMYDEHWTLALLSLLYNLTNRYVCVDQQQTQHKCRVPNNGTLSFTGNGNIKLCCQWRWWWFCDDTLCLHVFVQPSAAMSAI